jgi:chromosome segregation ATPase
MENDNTIIGWLLGGGGLAALAAGWKYIHDRRRETAVEGQHDSAFGKINAIADELRERVKDLELRCDKFAEERNVAQTQVARLEAEVKHLESDLTSARERIATLEGERNAARDLLIRLQDMYDTFKKEHKSIKEENDDLRRQLARLRHKDGDPHVWGEGYSHEA